MNQDILIVEDEKDIRTLVAGILEDEGYETRAAANSDQALLEIETRRPHLVLLDIWLQGSRLDGLGILKSVKRDHPDLPILMMSGHGTVETAVQAIKDGAHDFIQKPFKTDHLLLMVQRAIDAGKLRREVKELRLQAGLNSEMIGKSAAIRDIRQALERVAPSNSRVLITGPAGSGKEIAARTIHKLSKRANGSFVVVNCATMTPESVEESLFGRETQLADASTSIQVGTFETAHNGTLFLDEIADMPMETQGKIVRVLQEQNFSRIGGSTRVQVDVRVIAATTKSIPEAIASGRFREDLYYRLNVVPLEIPSLNARREDIESLAGHFMAQAAASTGQAPRKIGNDALAALQTYIWPGNVRELRNVIERMLIMAPGTPSQAIGISGLPPEIGADAPISRAASDQNQEIMGLPLRDAREVFEREYLNAQIVRFGGNISKTAEFVGMERSALHRKLKSLGIQSPERPTTDA
ncbi:MAG: sigma-54-dependent Fis family transcriptional regulator [Rhodospirillales bacterium]|nr:sigma-54-dependent Fis family transcriptional regulator [Rhodospirillales bacterium]